MKFMTALACLLTMLCSNFIFCQTLRRPLAAACTGFGAYSFNHTDIFSFIGNQASLAQLKYSAAGVYGERKFLLSELNNYTVVVGLPTHSGNFGIKAMYSGFNAYNETQLGLAYARSLGSKADIGIQFNYNGISIAGYGAATALSFEAGSIFHLSSTLHTGFHVSNPVGGRFGKDQQEKLPSVYTVGFGYEASSKFFFSAEIIKEENQPVNVNAGCQYSVISLVRVRGGISSATSTVWTGLGLSLSFFKIDIISSYHPQLGITPGLLLIIAPSSKKKANEEKIE